MNYNEADKKLILLQAVFECPFKNQLCKQEANGCVKCLSDKLTDMANDLDNDSFDTHHEVDELSHAEIEDWHDRFTEVFDADITARVYCWKRAVFYDHPDSEQPDTQD